MENTKKIIIAIPVLLWGGTEIQTLTLVRVMLSLGFSVIVCCYHEYDIKMVKRMEEEGAVIVLMELDRASGFIRLYIQLKKFFRMIQPEAVHVRYIAPGLLPIIAARAAGVKRIFATVGQLGNQYGLIPKIFIRIAATLADCFICTSREIECSWFGRSEMFSKYLDISGRKHVTIYNSVDIEKIIMASSDNKLISKKIGEKNRKVVSVVGRLRIEKGQAVLLDAFKHIVEEMPDTLLVLAGDGPDAAALQERAITLCIEDQVVFMGNLDQTEVYQLYGISSVVSIPSLYEGFGLAAVEAMAASTPVVASDVGGLKEIVKEGVTGYLFPVSDSQALARGVLKILESPKLAESMGDMAFQRTKMLFSFEKYLNTMSHFYRHFLDFD